MSDRARLEQQLSTPRPASRFSRNVASLVLLLCGIAVATLTLGLGLAVSPWFFLIFAGVIGLPLLLYVVVVGVTVPASDTKERR